ncbi:MAG: citrate lyase holo-[acyl-carrier protein] synthase [Lacrimispora sp.]|uniref:citrate lyase holo-[acyl-carrier protein] synthase n=1 Tax=Lacrimispora sp. TaxID=2719234 RepID=UPI0039E42436
MEEYVTLEEMLCFREEKVRIQEELRDRHPGETVVALGMNIPGPKKTSPRILLAFEEGEKTLARLFAQKELEVSEEAQLKENAGYLRFYSVKCPDAFFIKSLMIQIEESHPLGRLFDIDVYDADGGGIGRGALGTSSRRCLICGQDAKICGRSRNHGIEELYKHVENMIRLWLKEEAD